jgi:hypothetical protein
MNEESEAERLDWGSNVVIPEHNPLHDEPNRDEEYGETTMWIFVVCCFLWVFGVPVLIAWIAS